MLGLIRFFAAGFVVCSIAYVCIWLYLRAGQRERLEAAWQARGGRGSRDRFVRGAMAARARPTALILAALVYGVPLVTVVTIVYLTNQR